MAEKVVEIFNTNTINPSVTEVIEVDKQKIKELLGFLLSSFRGKLAIQNQNKFQPCQFDFELFLINFKSFTLESYFSNMMSVSLKFILEQGLLDPLLPYLKTMYKIHRKPKVNFLQKSLMIESSGRIVRPGEISNQSSSHPQLFSSKIRTKTIEKGNDTTEIIIHVFDEAKGIWQDFSCRQNILTQGMTYFSSVTVKGQNLQDMDISVHCEIGIFDWLLKWINSELNRNEMISEINAVNVVGLVVSAEFLQMSSLTTICLQFIYDYIDQVISNSPNLGCLTDSLIIQLALNFTNIELESKVIKLDRTDRISSRLYIQFILFLNYPEYNIKLGHYASSASLFKCRRCKQLLTNEFASKIPCVTFKYDNFGRQYSQHRKDSNWSFIFFLKDLKRKLKTWRKVYWRLWGIVNYFLCVSCKFYYPARLTGSCRYHPEKGSLMHLNIESTEIRQISNHRSQFSRKFSELPPVIQVKFPKTIESGSTSEDEIPIYSRKHSCCRVPLYNYTPMAHPQGCQNKDHLQDLSFLSPSGKLEIMDEFRELIVEEIEIDLWKHFGKFKQQSHKISTIGTALEEYKQSKGKWRQTQEQQESDYCSSSENDDGISVLANQYGLLAHASSRPVVIDLWSWNPELSTRYNQDMQREMEEKYMVKLAKQICQF